MSFYNFAAALLRIFFKILFSVRIEGTENIPSEGGFLIASNHKSNFDPPFLAGFLPARLTFMSKAELFKVPILGSLVKALGAFPVKRGMGDIGAIRTALKILSEKKNILIFPEGTRSKEKDKILDGKPGAALLAYKSKSLIVPVGISGNYRFRSRITIKIGIPIKSEEYFEGKASSEDLKRFTDEKIMKSIVDLSGAKYYGDNCCG